MKEQKKQLENAKVFDYKEGQIAHDIRETAYTIFPELTESEDEKMSRELIAYLKNNSVSIKWSGLDVKKAIEWLEKQGEQKYTQRDIDNAYLKGITDAKHEVEKESEKDKKIRADIAEFIFKSQENIKDRSKWIEYLGYIPTFVGEKNKIQK